jgi:hypothetical protein
MDTDEREVFRDQARTGILAAFGLDRPPSRRTRLARWLPGRRRMRRRWLAMERASAEARAREAEFAAALPGRMDDVAAEMNDRLSGVLPEGVRFEFAAREITHECPPDGQYVTPCCGLTPFELPRGDRITEDPALATCGRR